MCICMGYTIFLVAPILLYSLGSWKGGIKFRDFVIEVNFVDNKTCGHLPNGQR